MARARNGSDDSGQGRIFDDDSHADSLCSRCALNGWRGSRRSRRSRRRFAPVKLTMPNVDAEDGNDGGGNDEGKTQPRWDFRKSHATGEGACARPASLPLHPLDIVYCVYRVASVVAAMRTHSVDGRQCCPGTLRIQHTLAPFRIGAAPANRQQPTEANCSICALLREPSTVLIPQ